jgi:1-acyl-sn-glycerol-3-phosphate acyltransferase
MTWNPLRGLLRGLFRLVLRIYFREVEQVGHAPGRDTSGRLFAANHTNGLVDPILVMTSISCVVSPIAKATLWKIPGLRWLLDLAQAVPIVRRRDAPGKSARDNDAIFERVSVHLRGGGNILIFPEGTSHNEPHLVPLRSGGGRMLARAHEEGGRGLTFQAVGLEFDARDIFRSRSLVVFGPVRRVVDLAEGGRGGDALAKAITDQLEADLAGLVFEASTWEERLLLTRVAEVWANEGHDGSLAGVWARERRVREAKAALSASSPKLVAELVASVGAYFSLLQRAGTTDKVVASGGGLAGTRLLRIALLLAALPLAVVGALLYCLPYQLPRIVSSKVTGSIDEVSTYKIGTGLVVYPLWAALLASLSLLVARFQGLLPAGLWLSLTIASPIAAIAWLDRSERIVARLRGVVPRSPSVTIGSLLRSRAALVARLAEARALAERASHPDRADP